MFERAKDQVAIGKQLHAYLKLLSKKVNELNEANIRRHPVLKNLPTNFWITLDYLTNLEVGDLCYGISICHAAMRIMGKLDWWEAAIDRIISWDGTLETLQNKFILPNSNTNTPIVLYSIFDRLIDTIIFNHGDTIGINQQNVLLPGGPFLLLNNLNQQFEIKHNYKIAGHFDKNELIEILDNDTIKQALQNNICLVKNSQHACELSYQNNQWLFFDPYYQDGKTRSFDTLEDCINEVMHKLGSNIIIELACVEDLKNTPFMVYHQYLYNPERLRNLMLRGEGDGLFIFTKATPHLIPYVLQCLAPSEIFSFINKQFDRGATLLSVAAMAGSKEAIYALLSNSADPNIQDDKGVTPLMHTVDQGFSECINDLVASGADVNWQNIDNTTALILAANNQDINCIQALLDCGADPNIQNSTQYTALKCAVEDKNIDCIKLLLAHGANPLDFNQLESTSLYKACKNEDTEIFQLLMEKITNSLTLPFLSELSRAVRISRRTEILDIVYTQAKNYMQKNFYNEFFQEPEKIRNFLLSNEGEGLFILVKTIPQFLSYILHFLAPSETLPFMNKQYAKGETLLNAAVIADCKEAVYTLLTYTANPNIQDDNGMTSLMHAASQGFTDCINDLVTAGADVNLHNTANATALTIAVTNKNINFVKILLDHGANPYHTNQLECTALFIACNDGDTEIFKLLIDKATDFLTKPLLRNLSRVANQNGHKEISEILSAQTKNYLQKSFNRESGKKTTRNDDNNASEHQNKKPRR